MISKYKTMHILLTNVHLDRGGGGGGGGGGGEGSSYSSPREKLKITDSF